MLESFCIFETRLSLNPKLKILNHFTSPVGELHCTGEALMKDFPILHSRVLYIKHLLCSIGKYSLFMMNFVVQPRLEPAPFERPICSLSPAP